MKELLALSQQSQQSTEYGDEDAPVEYAGNVTVKVYE